MTTFDIEVLPNFVLFAFKKDDEVSTFKTWGTFSEKQVSAIKKIVLNDTIVTFNGINYDIPILNYVLLKSPSVVGIYNASKFIIEGNNSWFTTYKKMRIGRNEMINIDHIDLKEPAPAVMISLKNYGTRIGSKKLWEFPLDPHKAIDKKQAKMLVKYCINDLIVTEDLYNAIKPRLDLRERLSKQYDIDLMSKSDAQIGKAIIMHELNTKSGAPTLKASYIINYKPPKYIKFKSKQLKILFKDIKNVEFKLSNNGSPILPDILKNRIITMNKTSYKIAMGGLHDMNTQTSLFSDDENILIDADYSAYYPFMILTNGWYPDQLGKEYLDVYKSIVERRIKAKKEGDTLVDKSLKIVINANYGLLGNKYSPIYSPNVLLQVTLTGQLTLLMLIEKLESKGIPVVYCNTDGIVLNCPVHLEQKALKIMKKFDALTGLNMETEYFKSVHIRDVNNFVNVSADGQIKAKGVYGETTLMKGRNTPIVFEAIRKYLLDGTDMTQTIKSCKDVNQFVSARTVKGGGVSIDYETDQLPEDYEKSMIRNKRLTLSMAKKMDKIQAMHAILKGVELGKMVRWYYSKKGNTIYYKVSGNKVPMSEGSKPLMNLPEDNKIPKDLDYKWYFDYAKRMLKDLGV